MTGQQQIISIRWNFDMHPSSKIVKENLDVFAKLGNPNLAHVNTAKRNLVMCLKEDEKYGYLFQSQWKKNNANLKFIKASQSPIEVAGAR